MNSVHSDIVMVQNDPQYGFTGQKIKGAVDAHKTHS